MIEKLAIAHMTKLAGNDYVDFGKRLGSEFQGGLKRQWSDASGSFKRNITKGSKDKNWGAWKTMGNVATIGLPLVMLGLMGARGIKGLFRGKAGPKFIGIKPKHLYGGVAGMGALQYFGPKAAKKVGMGGMNPWDAAAYKAGIKR